MVILPNTFKLPFQVVCRTPPPQHRAEITEFGLQDTQQTLHPGRTQDDGSLCFACEMELRHDPAAGTLQFRGPWVHGPPSGRFLYLGLRERGSTSWLRRLKIPLAPITLAQVVTVYGSPGAALEATVAGSGSGTVPLLGPGWLIRQP